MTGTLKSGIFSGLVDEIPRGLPVSGKGAKEGGSVKLSLARQTVLRIFRTVFRPCHEVFRIYDSGL